jgi:hypothetical protein
MLFLYSAAIVALMWWWFVGPTARFLQGFARLLDPPVPDFQLVRLIGWAQSIAGRFNGRPLTLRVSQPREHQFGEIVLSMQADVPDGAPWKDSTLTARDADLARVTFDLEGRCELILTLAGGWLSARASAPLLKRFPGPFDAAKWSRILTQMDALAKWLEQRGRAPAPDEPTRP